MTMIEVVATSKPPHPKKEKLISIEDTIMIRAIAIAIAMVFQIEQQTIFGHMMLVLTFLVFIKKF